MAQMVHNKPVFKLSACLVTVLLSRPLILRMVWSVGIYGPYVCAGMNKMVINHLEKLFVTSDAGTVIRELEVEHPAARMIVMATKMMEQEVRSVLSVVEEAGFWLTCACGPCSVWQV